jgi:hypothetical protein
MTLATASHPRRSAWALGGLGVLACLAGAPRSAHAQGASELRRPFAPRHDSLAELPAVQVAPPLPVVTRSWYGYQLMASDAASIGMLFTRGTAPLGGITFFGAPPTIHGLHGNLRMAIVSPAMRIGLPLVGMVLGSSAEHCERNPDSSFDMCGVGGALAGATIGLFAAMVADYALAWQTTVSAPVAVAPATPPSPDRRVRLSSARIAPTAGGATLVLGGSF